MLLNLRKNESAAELLYNKFSLPIFHVRTRKHWSKIQHRGVQNYVLSYLLNEIQTSESSFLASDVCACRQLLPTSELDRIKHIELALMKSECHTVSFSASVSRICALSSASGLCVYRQTSASLDTLKWAEGREKQRRLCWFSCLRQQNCKCGFEANCEWARECKYLHIWKLKLKTIPKH